MAIEHWLTLSLTSGIGPIKARRIIEAAGDVQSACSASANLLKMVEGIGTNQASKIAAGLRSAADQVSAELEKAAATGARIICTDDADYPALLREIPDPPLVLYVRGAFEPRDLHAVAIVGSRRCSHYGREQAERFGALLAGSGVTVVSGGARGIDSAAHRGAISHPIGRTIAVLGSGIDVPYPAENAPLFNQIAARGAVVSEYPMGTAPTPENFPRRNRIVSGMSRGVLVIEADEKSGALITARQAIEDHNRTVFALPGRVDNLMSAGPHKLIRDGATLVRNLEDILEDLGPLPQSIAGESAPAEPQLPFGQSDPSPAAPPATSADQPESSATAPPVPAAGATVGLTAEQSLLLAQFNGSHHSIDQLIEQTALPASAVLQGLTFLSLRGLVRRVDGQTYARGRAR
jgi:DNA processing protein